MKSSRICEIEKRTTDNNPYRTKSHFVKDYHYAGLHLYNECELWEKIARSMAYAIVNQDIFVDESDRIGGRVFQGNENDLTGYELCEDFLYREKSDKAFFAEYPEGKELDAYQLLGGCSEGHISWFFDLILQNGVEGFKAMYEKALTTAKDEEAKEFYSGVIILLDALLEFNDKCADEYEKIGKHELAMRMRKVPRKPAETFREAVQAFYMQHIVVMLENPRGGNSPGRLDYYLWPYLERDLDNGVCTLEEAREIIDELFLRFEERLYPVDGWVEVVIVGGTNADGTSSVNPLTYMMIEAIMEFNITHPSVYVRIPENPPEELIKLCARYMMSGNNRAQILNDKAIMGAITKQGISFSDASYYGCGGCMEVHMQGMTSDHLYLGWQNIPKMLELMITGGECLLTGKRVNAFKATKGLCGYDDFESFYADFIKEAKRITDIFFRRVDINSEFLQKYRPGYLISSMLDNCLERGRNMHAGGVKYHEYGATQLGLPDTSDALYAIKKAVFDDKICTAKELVEAMKADYNGYEELQKKLRQITKYGVNDDEADAMAARVMSDFADMYLTYRTRWGATAKPVILTFRFAPDAAKVLGATADGFNSHKIVAQAITPHSHSMTEGITSAINSCTKMPFEKFSGGASSMWDFDSAWANEELISAVLKTFLDKNGQIFQGNTTSLTDLINAKENPDAYRNLIVRVGGYSARFTALTDELQDEVIARMRHKK